MTGEELQRAISNFRMEVDGSVSLAELPSAKQLDMLLYIDSERCYFDYTPLKAMEDILLYYQYKKYDWRKVLDELDWDDI